MGFYDYVLGIAPTGLRPSYVGLANTIMGGLTVAPLLGGWLLEATSYPFLFCPCAVAVALGFLITLRLQPMVLQEGLEGEQMVVGHH